MGFIKKMDGAISVFLTIIMAIMMVLAGLLVDASRMRTAEVQVQSALDSAALSALAWYNGLLKDKYGLFALADNNSDNLKEEVESYLNKNLMTELGVDKKTASEKAYDYLKKIFTGDGKYEDANFLNLYDYRVEDVKVTPVYNLAENDVLKSQLVEYMKYRAPKELTEDFLDKLKAFKEFGSQSGIMKKKVSLDKTLGKIRKSQEDLSEQAVKLNAFDREGMKAKVDAYFNGMVQMAQTEMGRDKEEEAKRSVEASIANVATQIAAASSIEDEESRKSTLDSLNNTLSGLNEELGKINAEIASLEMEIKRLRDESSKTRDVMLSTLKDFQDYNEKATQDVQSIIDKSKSANGIITEIESDVKDDESDFATNIRSDVGGKKKSINPTKLEPLKKKFEKNQQILKEMQDNLNQVNPNSVHYGDYGLSMNDTAVSAKVEAKIQPGALKEKAVNYNDGKNVRYYLAKGKKDESQKNILKNADSAVANREENMGGKMVQEKQEENKPEDSFPKDGLPSGKNGKLENPPDFSKEDQAYITTVVKGYLDGTVKSPEAVKGYPEDDMKKALDSINGVKFSDEDSSSADSCLDFIMGLGDMIAQGLEKMRDELYVDEYAVGTFKNVLSAKQIPSRDDPVERDLRDREKGKDMKTYFSSEVEYILHGNANQSKNETLVEAQILLVRFALNTLHVYTDSAKYNTALAVATSIAGWTGFGVPIIHTLLMLGWAMAESILDVKYLLEGRNVPVFKTAQTWVLSINGIAGTLSQAAADGLSKIVDETVDYGTDSIEKITKTSFKKLDGFVESKVEFAVNYAFAPLENALEQMDEFCEGATADLSGVTEDGMDVYLNTDSIETDMDELQKEIITLVKEEFQARRVGIEAKINGLEAKFNSGEDPETLIDEIKTELMEQKTQVTTLVLEKISGYEDKIKTKISEVSTDAADVAREKLKRYIQSLSGKSAQNSTKTDIGTSLLSFNYRDYLRLFLLITDNDKKLNRIEDLIQLNMQEQGVKDFKLRECNTYLRTDAEVSIKYLFIPLGIVPEEFRIDARKRFKITSLLYKGY